MYFEPLIRNATNVLYHVGLLRNLQCIFECLNEWRNKYEG